MAYAADAHGADERDRRRIPVLWFGGVAAALAIVGLGTLSTTRAAFSANTGNSGSSFTAGTVALTDDDANSVLFNVPAMLPGRSVVKCINVTYAGVPADVRLYGAVTNLPAGKGPLAGYLTTLVEEGTGATGTNSFSCANFTPTSTVHGVAVNNVTLADFGTKTNFANGIPVLAAANAGNAGRSYRITMTLADDNTAQGKDASVTFTWEAQNR